MKLLHQRPHQPHHIRRRTARPISRPHRHGAVRLLASSILVAVAVVASVTPAQARALPRQSECVRHDARVVLTPDSHAIRYRVAGWLCGARTAKTVQLLMSGFTYDHHYWTGADGRTSYVAAALDAGSAVYNIDRIGVGQSDRAPAAQLDVTSEAYVADQLTRKLRDGTLGRYDHVVGVGHSYGTAIWMVAAAHYHDVDAVVLTGLLHQLNTPALTSVVGSLHPASADPAFAHTVVPDGYLTTMPGTRGDDFYFTPGANRDMIKWDERTKATGTTAELDSGSMAEDLAVSHDLHLPVLLIVGDHDAIVCDASTGLPCGTGNDICQRERPFYPPGSPLYTATIARTGHSINLHGNAPREFAIANQWIAQTTAGIAPRTDATRCPAGAAA